MYLTHKWEWRIYKDWRWVCKLEFLSRGMKPLQHKHYRFRNKINRDTVWLQKEAKEIRKWQKTFGRERQTVWDWNLKEMSHILLLLHWVVVYRALYFPRPFPRPLPLPLPLPLLVYARTLLVSGLLLAEFEFGRDWSPGSHSSSREALESLLLSSFLSIVPSETSSGVSATCWEASVSSGGLGFGSPSIATGELQKKKVRHCLCHLIIMSDQPIQRSLCFHLGDEDGKPLEAGCAAPTSSASFDVSNTSFGIQRFPIGSKVAPRANTAAFIRVQVNKENQPKHHPKPMVVTNPKCVTICGVSNSRARLDQAVIYTGSTVKHGWDAKEYEYTEKKKDLTRRRNVVQIVFMHSQKKPLRSGCIFRCLDSLCGDKCLVQNNSTLSEENWIHQTDLYDIKHEGVNTRKGWREKLTRSNSCFFNVLVSFRSLQSSKTHKEGIRKGD